MQANQSSEELWMPKKFARGGGARSKKKQKIPRPLRPAAPREATTVRVPPPAAAFARPAASAIQSVRRPPARSSRAAAALPTDYGYVATDLRRLGVMAGGAVVVLGVLAIVLR